MPPGRRCRHSQSPTRSFCHPATLVLALISLAYPAVSTPSAFDTYGPNAERLADIWWLMFWAAVPIYLFTVGLLVYALVRSRRRDTVVDPLEIRYPSLLIGGGVVLPIIVIVPLTVITVLVGNDLTTGDEEENLTIEVTGHQWWWEVHYPEADATTANEIHIPTNRPIRVELTSADVIHSFWVPQLQGKIDLIPGKTNTQWLEANEPGTFRGLCAEFCGIQHTNMLFLVVAEEPDSFDAWLEQQAQPAEEPTDELAREGEDVFVDSPCSTCHQIRGVNDEIRPTIAAPDLTHIGSRQEIAAGTLDNTRGNMGGWILDPQNIKPGNLMHGTNLQPEQLHALLSYLESLE